MLSVAREATTQVCHIVEMSLKIDWDFDEIQKTIYKRLTLSSTELRAEISFLNNIN